MSGLTDDVEELRAAMARFRKAIWQVIEPAFARIARWLSR